eukprot:13578186-Alexandrium_andersonii.AAC.1
MAARPVTSAGADPAGHAAAGDGGNANAAGSEALLPAADGNDQPLSGGAAGSVLDGSAGGDACPREAVLPAE